VFRCHFTRIERPFLAVNINVSTLDAAITTGLKILADELDASDFHGIEVWMDSALLYRS
jgi:hypothetical protein